MRFWEKFEEDCTKYLNSKFGEYAKFIHQGKSDSTLSDILVKTNSGNSFYIDAKYTPAQCGQFVLRADDATQTFIYSEKNATGINDYSKTIIEYMNENFNTFKTAGTVGKDIIFKNCEKVFSCWIINMYKLKKTKFFITNGYKLFPLEQFSDYFEVSAKYREKKSGSSIVGNTLAKSLAVLLTNTESNEYRITKTRTSDNRLFVSSPRNLHMIKFSTCNHEFMFSKRNDEYEVRKLSKTNNSNVIFSIKAKGELPSMSNDEFKNVLQ